MKRRLAIIILAVLGAAGCQDSGGEGADAAADTGSDDFGFAFDAGTASDAGVDAGAPDSGVTDAGSDASPDAGIPDSGPDAGVDAGADAGEGDTGGDGGLPPDLTPDEIGFEESNPPLTGSFIYYGNWGVNAGDKDSVEMIRPDGSETATRFVVSRLWSFGVARDAKTIAFSSVDPYQERNWGVTIGDAIQYTFLFRPGAAPYQVTRGNINDECHSFMPGDTALLMCRRANFWQSATGSGNDPFRLLEVEIATGAATWLTPLDTKYSDIGPALRDDGSILFWRQEFKNNKSVQSLMQMNGDGSGIAYVAQDSTAPVTSADGAKVLFRSGGWRTLVVAPSHDLASTAQVAYGGTEMIFDYDFSPDTTQVVFTMSHNGANCDDVYTVNIDGTARQKIVDCVTANKFPSGVKWAEVK